MTTLRAAIDFFSRNLKRICVVSIVAVALYALVGFFIVPRIIKAVVPEKVSAASGRPFDMETVSFNPFTLRLHITGISLSEPDGSAFVNVDAVTLNAEILPLLAATPTLESLVVQAPRARVVRRADGSFNFSDMIPATPPAARAAKTTPPAPMPTFMVRRLAVVGARFDWTDHAVSPAVSAAVDELDLTVTGLGSRTRRPATYELAVTTNVGATIQADGGILLSALASRGHIQIEGVSLPAFAAYAAPYFNGRIDDGRIAIGFDYRYPSAGDGMGLPAVHQAEMALTDLKVAPPGKGEPLVDLKRLALSGVNFEPDQRYIGIGDFSLADTRLNLARGADGHIDLLSLVTTPAAGPPDAAAASAETGGAPPWRLGVAEAQVSGISAVLRDNATAEPAVITVDDAAAGLSGLSLLVGKNTGMPTVADARLDVGDVRIAKASGAAPMVAVPRFAVAGVQFFPDQHSVFVESVSTEGGRIQVVRDRNGEFDLLKSVTPAGASGAPNQAPTGPTSGDEATAAPWVLRVARFALADYGVHLTDQGAAAAPSEIAVTGIGAGVSDVAVTVGAPLPRLAAATLTLGGLRLAAAGQEKDIVALGGLEVAQVNLDPESRRLSVGSVALSGGEINLIRHDDGSINAMNALMPARSENAESPRTPPPAAERPETGQDPFAALPVIVDVADVNIADIAVDYQDNSLKTPAAGRFSDTDIKLKNLSTERGHTGTLDLHIVGVREGSLSAGGDIVLNPPSASLAVDAKGLSLIPGQPYIAEQVKALITKGKMDAKGRLTVSMPWDGPLHLTFNGEGGINKFGTVDQKTVQDLMSWESLYFSGIDIRLMPLVINLDEVALTDYYARVAVNPDGSINVRDVMGGEDAPKAEKTSTPPETPAGAAGRPPAIRIEKVTLQGGVVDFSDNSIIPAFDTQMRDLGGTVSGLSSEDLARADVFLAGRLENLSPLKITGQINPLIEDRYTDLQIEFSDIDLSPFSPYSGKYIGRRLDKGKLTLVLGYKINGNKLSGENKVFLDQFTLGDNVDSPEAINLPLDLAVALLKDPSGRIQLDLPVRGELDDPEFSLGGVIFQLLINTVTKIITAPFAALGNLAGGGTEMRYVDFEPGSARLTPAAVETLEKIAAAMAERPGINIDVQGEVDPEPDALSLRERQLEALVRAEMRRERVTSGADTAAGAEAPISDEAFAVYIKRVYDSADIAKPRNPDGTLKKLPPEEMKKLVFTSLDVSEADLRRLANQRAEAAMAAILADGRVGSGRVFLREPDMAPPAGEKGEPVERFGRVNFAIRK